MFGHKMDVRQWPWPIFGYMWQVRYSSIERFHFNNMYFSMLLLSSAQQPLDISWDQIILWIGLQQHMINMNIHGGVNASECSWLDHPSFASQFILLEPISRLMEIPGLRWVKNISIGGFSPFYIGWFSNKAWLSHPGWSTSSLGTATLNI